MTLRFSVALLILIGGIAAAACLYYWPAATPAVAVPTAPSCVNDPEVFAAVISGATLDIPARPEAGTKPVDFRATSAVVCGMSAQPSYLDRNPPAVQTTYSGNSIGDVEDALAATSYKFVISILGGCSGDYPNPPVLWLVDDSGLGYRPTFPRNHCGRPIYEPLRLLYEQTADKTEEVEVPQVR